MSNTKLSETEHLEFVLTNAGVPVDSANLTTHGIEGDCRDGNRRSGERLKLSLSLTSEGTTGKTLNISSTGLRYAIPGVVEPGAQLDLLIQFRNGISECKADVVWVESFGHGSVVGARFRDDKGSKAVGRKISQIVDSTKRFFHKSGR